jgi:hypothetical protein
LIKEIEYFLIYKIIDQNLVLKMDYYTLCFFKRKTHYCLSVPYTNETIEALYEEKVYTLKPYEEYLNDLTKKYCYLFLVLLIFLIYIKKMNFKYRVVLYVN